MKNSISAARTVLAALALSIAFAAALPGAASADVGFGYNDPRSIQITATSFDVLPDGGIVYLQNERVYELTPAGRVELLAGGGRRPIGLSPIPATNARLGQVIRIAASDDGGVLLAGLLSSSILELTPEGTISRIAGNGTSNPSASSGDGGPATDATLLAPFGLAPTGDGGFLIADVFSSSVREVSPDRTIDTIAGGNGVGTGGDGGPATEAQLSAPAAVEPTADGGVLIGDVANARVRRVSPDGTITTVAGGNGSGFSGDGGQATSAQLSGSSQFALAGVLDLQPMDDGGFLLVDSANRRIRRVGPDGVINTVAGTGGKEFNGDGIPATKARISPREIAPTNDGGFVILDAGRIRKVSTSGEITTIAGMPAPEGCPASTYNGIQGASRPDALTGAALQDLIRGEGGADEIESGDGDDCVSGGAGDDRISTAAGDDVVVGDRGADAIEGGEGRDALSGTGGEDAIFGGDGVDRLSGGEDDDSLSGGTGNDTIDASDGSPDRVRCGPGKDAVRADRLDRIAPNCERVTGLRR